ncbi:MAG: SOS response-associated peptidase family protein [Eggerthellaceae bacterium]|jgi:putative SOS response-associated peptidase YedK
MCGRFTGLTYEQTLAAIDDLSEQDPPRFVPASAAPDADYDWPVQQPTVVPGVPAWVIVPSGKAADGRPIPTAQQLTFGFALTWKDGLVFNTRFESALADKGMWAGALDKGRCLVPVREFFEPHNTERVLSPRTGRPIKRQYRFFLRDVPVTYLGGVCQDGRFSLVTVPPNRIMAPIHRRMPLILLRQEAQHWLYSATEEIRANAASYSDRNGIALTAAPETDDAPLETPNQLPLF